MVALCVLTETTRTAALQGVSDSAVSVSGHECSIGLLHPERILGRSPHRSDRRRHRRRGDQRLVDESERQAKVHTGRHEGYSRGKGKNDQRTREEWAKFAAVCVDVINAATDTKGVFNMVRDQAYAAAGLPDPRTTEKIDYAELQATENQRLAKAYAQLKLVAPNEILDKALELNTASLTLLKVITQPLAKPLLAAKAGQALDEYTNAVRAHLGLNRHSTDEAQRVTATYLQTLKEQVDAYLAQAEEEARASSHT
jgi:hypothetical protein